MKAIEAENLTKIYPPDTRAVDSITFSVDEGEVFGLLGPNGAGKTTTIKMITALTIPTSGWMKVFGEDVRKHPREVRQMQGYVPQAISVDGDLTGYENLLIFAKLCYVPEAHREELIRDALEYMDLTERSDDLVKHYSGGMMRRLEIAQALVNRPRILFLDEPSIGLDPFSRRQVIGYVKQLNEKYKTTILITTHDMAEADELCHRLAIMNAGRFAVIGSHPTSIMPAWLQAISVYNPLTYVVDAMRAMLLTGDYANLPVDIGALLLSTGLLLTAASIVLRRLIE